ncbi:MAG: glycosyltransferase [Candidatus Liptonbacteria bacterium]|nr:glycosyltransferase [Candidatus Liptonbacteria bacterium]
MITAKVSIIIPSYNAGAYVKEAVDSALAQTYPHCEIIVVDDGSTDDTQEILAPYAEKGSVQYVYQDNKGLAGARNTAIKIARGEYIAFLDADDVFIPQKMERQVQYLKDHAECDVSYCDLYHFWDGRPETLLKLDYRYYSGDEVLPNLIKRDFIAPLSMLVRKSVFEKFGLFDEHFRRSEDLEFLVRILRGGARICFLDEILAKLRLRRTSNLQGFLSQPEVKKTGLAVFENLYDNIGPEERERLKLKKYLALYRLKVGLAYLENNNKMEAKKFMYDSFSGFRGGYVFGRLFWFLIVITPGSLLSSFIRYYHLKKQDSNLEEIT